MTYRGTIGTWVPIRSLMAHLSFTMNQRLHLELADLTGTIFCAQVEDHEAIAFPLRKWECEVWALCKGYIVFQKPFQPNLTYRTMNFSWLPRNKALSNLVCVRCRPYDNNYRDRSTATGFTSATKMCGPSHPAQIWDFKWIIMGAGQLCTGSRKKKVGGYQDIIRIGNSIKGYPTHRPFVFKANPAVEVLCEESVRSFRDTRSKCKGKSHRSGRKTNLEINTYSKEAVLRLDYIRQTQLL